MPARPSSEKARTARLVRLDSRKGRGRPRPRMASVKLIAGTMELVVVVSSCDSFRDAWAPFFYFFAKRWPDCPFPVYLITNHGTYRDPLVRCLPVGRDRGWSDNLSLALNRIETPHILYLQEDYFLTRPVHTEHLREDIAFMQRHRAAYLGLCPIPTPEEPVFDSHPRIGRLAAEAAM